MSFKKQTHRKNKPALKQRAAEQDDRKSETLVQEAQLKTIRRPLLGTKPLLPRDFLQFQDRIGNGAIGRLLVGAAQPQSTNSENKSIQRTPDVVPASDQERKDIVQDTIRFFNGSADFYRNQGVVIEQALFERLINNWYLMVVEREQMIDEQLDRDPQLRRELRAAYTAAIRVLMSKAARVFGKSERALYHENSGRIPLWAWQTAHHMELGISTPIAEGRATDILTREVSFSTNGFQVPIAPDASEPSLGNRAETRQRTNWSTPAFQWQSQGASKLSLLSLHPAPLLFEFRPFTALM